jgi:hypothetical protein
LQLGSGLQPANAKVELWLAAGNCGGGVWLAAGDCGGSARACSWSRWRWLAAHNCNTRALMACSWQLRWWGLACSRRLRWQGSGLQLVTVAVVLWLAAGNYGAVVVVVTAVMVLWLAADDVLLNCGRGFLSFCRSGDVDSCCWWLWLIGAFFHVTAVIFC